MNPKILKISLIAALAGFLFGFDTVVISGAEKKLQLIWNTSDLFHGSFVIGMALWGTVVGAIFGCWPTDKLGRKTTLVWIGVLYTVSAIGSAWANDPYVFGIARFIGGLGVGASTVAAPTYISEIAPAKDRGRLVGLYQFMLVFGILIAFISNYLLRNMGENDWRWMVGVEAIPAFIYTLFALTIPKSARWLLTKGRTEEVRQVLALTTPELTVEGLKADIEKSVDGQSGTSENIIIKKYRLPLMLALVIAFFNQYSGKNAII